MKRLETGGRIDRKSPLKVTFEGRDLPAFQGDTLASAMLAAGLSTVGRSFKYHRPRGVFSAGVEEPNAMVHLRDGARHEPNARATVTEAFDGLVSTGQNAWPSLSYDVGVVNNLLSPFLSAGFYYKTFIGVFRNTTKYWMFCEKFIRKAAGMGRATYLEDPDSYEKRNAFCDVLIVGAGAAGLSAALAAGRSGARVLLVEQDFQLGGALLSEPVGPADQWLACVVDELERLSNVQILARTTAVGAYDSDTYSLIERVADHTAAPENHQVRQRFWTVHAKRCVMATGAIERPLVFGGNDKPGVMLAHAARTYLNRFAVLSGQRAVVATNNDSAYATAAELARGGSKVTIVDTRPDVAEDIKSLATDAGATVLLEHGVLQAKGIGNVTAVTVSKVDAEGRAKGVSKPLKADLVAVSGGWAPVVHLWSQRHGKPVFDAASQAFVANTEMPSSITCAGACAAASSFEQTVEQGFKAGQQAGEQLAFMGDTGTMPEVLEVGPFWQTNASATWACFGPNGKTVGKAFIDHQHDVKLSDIDQAHLEGYVSVEHLKRYTTLGMATDQGKLSNINALSRMADLKDEPIQQVGTTTFRPPFTPVSIGALVGHEHGKHFQPTRLSPIHAWHVQHGAVMTEAGAWLRPWYYPQDGETLREAYVREAAHVREHVGMVDVSTLGKIAVQGPDAAEFLNRIYINGWKTLAIGRLRYGVMLREDGIVMDDGATARLGEHDYFMSTTTANAAKVLAFAERLLQTAWQDLKVHVTSLTDQWAAIAVAGPKSRALLENVTHADLSAENLPNNHWIDATLDDVPIRLHRMSFSGELAYELYIPSGFATRVWEALDNAGPDFQLRPYGTESMGTLRIEKGHVAGPELDGRTALRDLGLDGFASSKKPFVGSVLRKREGLEDPDRPALVGLEIKGDRGTKPGALLFAKNGETKGHGEGWVSSTTYSPALGKNIAMAFLKGGQTRIGETVRAVDFLGDETLEASVVSHHFFDPEGVRQNA